MFDQAERGDAVSLKQVYLTIFYELPFQTSLI